MKIINCSSEYRPLIHCITNPISINQCANAVLAVGGRPIMAEHPGEVDEITRTASALVLNLGNITDVRMQSMRISAAAAQDAGIPVIIDLVGIACSELRRNFALKLISDFPVSVLKGNYSEIMSLLEETYHSSGVDAAADVTSQDIRSAAAELASRYRAVIMCTGKIDVRAGESEVRMISNGTPQLGTITGTGCMLAALTGRYLAEPEAEPIDASSYACCMLGIAGERAETDKGSGTFMVSLFDQLSTLTPDEIDRDALIEEA